MATKKWKEFEEIIARLEQALHPSGFIVQSPDKLLDKVTGELREVDVSIRNSREKSQPVVLIIECRDRVAVQDVLWIEQLVTKQKDIEIPKIIAVSSSGFSSSAMKKAEFHKIETRSTKEVTLKDFAGWLGLDSLTLYEEHWWVDDIEIELYGAPSNTQPSEMVQLKIQEQKKYAPVFVRVSDGVALTLDEIITVWEKKNGSRFSGVPRDGVPVGRFISQPIENDALSIDTTTGTHFIKLMNISLGLRIDVKNVPLTQLLTYSDAVRPLAEVAEWRLANGLVVSLIRDLTKGQIRVKVTSHGA